MAATCYIRLYFGEEGRADEKAILWFWPVKVSIYSLHVLIWPQLYVKIWDQFRFIPNFVGSTVQGMMAFEQISETNNSETDVSQDENITKVVVNLF